MKVTGIWSLAGAAILGIILADLLIHPAGTSTLANALTTTQKVTVNGLLGKSS